MASDIKAIEIKDITKIFKKDNNATSIKRSALNLKNVFLKHDALNDDKFIALKDISFDIKKGEFFGIVGRNGSGKSTLLKLIAGVYTPTKGSIIKRGKLTPFIELGVGFNPELSGKDNVYLNAALLGFSRKQTDNMYNDIVDFAELHEFMDLQLKHYSSGMQVRLAFSVAIKAQSDIILIDEVLAVGDVNFQRKSIEYFREIKRSGKTVVFVTHDSTAVQNFCDRAALIDKSKLIAVDTPDKVLAKYNEINVIAITEKQKNHPGEVTIDDKNNLNDTVIINEISLNNSKDLPQTAFRPNEKIKIKIIVQSTKDIKNITIRIAAIHKSGGPAVFVLNSKDFPNNISLKKGYKTIVTFELENIFDEAELVIKSSIFDSEESEQLGRYNRDVILVSLGRLTKLKGSTYPKAKMLIN